MPDAGLHFARAPRGFPVNAGQDFVTLARGGRRVGVRLSGVHGHIFILLAGRLAPCTAAPSSLRRIRGLRTNR